MDMAAAAAVLERPEIPMVPEKVATDCKVQLRGLLLIMLAVAAAALILDQKKPLDLEVLD